MSLDASDKAIIERWSGTVDDADIEALELRMDRLGTPYVVALEVLMIRMSDMMNDPLRMRLDGDATWETDKNVVELRARIGGLASYVKGLSGLNLAARDLCAQAARTSASGDTVRVISYDLTNVRPGA